MASLDVGLECEIQIKRGTSGSLMAWKHLNVESGKHFLVTFCYEVNRVHFKLSHTLLNRICIFLLMCNVSLLLLISFLKMCSINPHAPQFSCYCIITTSDICCSPIKSAVCLIFSVNVIFYESCDKSRNQPEKKKQNNLRRVF